MSINLSVSSEIIESAAILNHLRIAKYSQQFLVKPDLDHSVHAWTWNKVDAWAKRVADKWKLRWTYFSCHHSTYCTICTSGYIWDHLGDFGDTFADICI